MQSKDSLIQERRQYIRLDTVFPVQFRLLAWGTDKLIFERAFQGFTSNIGKGGLCLEVNNLSDDELKVIRAKSVELAVEIELPFAGNPVLARASVSWVQDIPGASHKHIIGLSYREIDVSQSRKILRYAWMKKMFVPAVISVTLLLGLGFGIDSYINVKLIKGNRTLVEQLIRILQESSIAKQKIKVITKDKEDLQLKIQALQLQIRSVEEEKKKLEEANTRQKVQELNALADKLSDEKNSLQEELIAVQHREDAVTDELLHLDQRRSALAQANLDKMYQWLKIHQNPRTGLVMSYEGDNDMPGWAFTYDQALMVGAYTYFSDFDRAKKILDFFQKKAKRTGSIFLNAYYALDGSPAEYAVHSGPNIWLGIAALQYTHKSRDQEFLGFAEDIAKAVTALQDNEGGVRGGPDVSWYATEHNLDAYAFFNMLSKVTGKVQYKETADRILNWLSAHTYDNHDVPVRRGKGDSAIATDTYAWSLAAIGPEKLQEIGMNPERILEYAEEHCAQETDYLRPDGKTVKIKGFDFAAKNNLARGGVISCEFSAQMILAYKIIADYYFKKEMIAKARSYELKASEYMGDLANMVISSPSPSGQGESCLPYASQDMTDTGHGWVTPKGRSTGSVAATVWTLFAYYKYNPLALEK